MPFEYEFFLALRELMQYAKLQAKIFLNTIHMQVEKQSHLRKTTDGMSVERQNSKNGFEDIWQNNLMAE